MKTLLNLAFHNSKPPKKKYIHLNKYENTFFEKPTHLHTTQAQQINQAPNPLKQQKENINIATKHPQPTATFAHIFFYIYYDPIKSSQPNQNSNQKLTTNMLFHVPKIHSLY